MKRLGIILASAMMVFVSCVSQEKGCREYEGLILTSSYLNREVSYSVVLPNDYYHSRKSYPVLYLFHCIGGDSSTGIEYCDITHVLDSLTRKRVIEPMIVVMPDVFLSYCSNAYDGSFPYESMLLEELLPEVENKWRTNGTRGTMGFSMGGFGAMSIAMRHTDMFGSVAALSPSVRTDYQYATEEPQSGWENQWGRIFGGIGLSGEDRITEYYKNHCPLHLVSDLPLEQFEGFDVFLTVGNRESGSLAESNEALHLAMANRDIPHVWRVSDGGHDFAFWRKNIPDALRFISCSFEGRHYSPIKEYEPRRHHSYPKPENLDNVRVYMPESGCASTRKYPYVCVFGSDESSETDIMEYYSAMYSQGSATAIAFCFFDGNYKDALELVNQNCTKLRHNQRMRSAICFGSAATQVQEMMMKENLFTNVVFAEISDTIPAGEFASAIKTQRRYPKIILASMADAPSYQKNSDLHVALKNAGLSHSHYAYEKGSGKLLWHFPEWLKAINYKFHD